MNIIILGAGQVGGALAETLVREDNDITLVDADSKRLRELSNRLDIRTVAGQASLPNVLQRAGGESADMLIAVTSSDETNLVACQVAYSLFRTPTKIARIRQRQYLLHAELFGLDAFPIDVFISPENLVTNYIKRLIEYPGALQVLDFADENVQLIALKPDVGRPCVCKSLEEIAGILNVNARIVAIYRGNKSLSISATTTIEKNDEVFLIASRKKMKTVLALFKQTDNPYKKIIIAGGGNIGKTLAQTLQKDFQVKLIESNTTRAKLLSQTLSHTIILQGDACDEDLLFDENIEHTDVFVALTNDDEVNIMSCLLAKRYGVRKAMALTTRTAYVDLIEAGEIDIAISPQMASIGSILRHIRHGDIVNVHSLRRGAAEAIEIIAHGDAKTSKVVGKRVSEIKLPKGCSIGAIVRHDEVILNDDDAVIASNDHVILFLTDKKRIVDVERIFQVSATYF